MDMSALAITSTTILLLYLLTLTHHVQGVMFLKIKGTGRDDDEHCDVYEGKWVEDESYPLYDTSQCPFIEKEFDCLKNGRPDREYLKYRWQPNECSIPRFDGKEFLSKILKGKSIMFVGDSLGLNQWQSLTCMLHVAVPQAKYTSIRTDGLSSFTFPEYKAKVMFSRNAFLVDMVSTSNGTALILDSIQAGDLWKHIDFLVFDTWHWWLHTGRKQPWNFIQVANVTYQDMDRLVAYELALKTWAKWVDTNVDPAKTKVFFQGVSPDHMNGNDWGEANAKNCEGQKQPLLYPVGNKYEYPAGSHPAQVIVERVIGVLAKSVHLLNVTALSQLRIDGHPSVYGHGGHNDMDCSHWCLAGVPDTWNQLLYAALLNS